ncbi:unnamed protein product [Microthlaspi erraticum]|uniref:GCK domain-containing protein n=1 Tax=Microthlaspi erraticum TaxID=1685480 RepID=A0A6D2JPN1_9BRAS|nr:unnamed protein product [Microthlaspi erraticum]
MEVLRARRDDVLTEVQRKESEGLKRLSEVQVWLTSVEDIQNQVYELLLPRTAEVESWEKHIRKPPDILERARQVARKCRGLPLALIIIGKNMASKRTVQEWDEAIDTLASSAANFLACLLMKKEETNQVKMHDVVREMALWIANDFGKDEERCIVQAGVGLREGYDCMRFTEVEKANISEFGGTQLESISGISKLSSLRTLRLAHSISQDLDGMKELQLLEHLEVVTIVSEDDWLPALGEPVKAFTEGGECKDLIIDYIACKDEAEEKNEDSFTKCKHVKEMLDKCYDAHSDYCNLHPISLSK